MASKQQQQYTIKTVIALLIVLEIVLHFCWEILDSYFFTNFTVTTEIAIIAVILLLVVLFFREELVMGLFGGGKVSVFGGAKRRYGHHYGGIAKAGSFGVVEALVFVAYVFCAAMLTGLVGVNIGTDTKTMAVAIVVVAGIILLAQKAHLKFTALEMVTFAIAVMLPIMASGVIPQLTLPSNWLSDALHKIAVWGISCVSCVIMAFQD